MAQERFRMIQITRICSNDIRMSFTLDMCSQMLSNIGMMNKTEVELSYKFDVQDI